jgi:putative phosphoribosyl transferase
MVSVAIYEGIKIPIGKLSLLGDLEIPNGSSSLVLFSHGSGSSRVSARNQAVARELRHQGIGTFLFDLLAKEEDMGSAGSDVELLTKRLLHVTSWVLSHNYSQHLSIGYCGSGIGAASALNVAAMLGKRIKAVVSRGGRPDLAMTMLPDVTAATLLAGELDIKVIEKNELALEKLKGPKKLTIIPGASHLFDERGKLGSVATLAAEWFDKYLR